MYPPQEDYIIQNPDGSIQARSRSHTIDIGVDGNIKITNRRLKQVEFTKSGGGK